MEAVKERMLEACQTGDERVVREIVSSLPYSVGFVFGEVDFLFVSFFVLLEKLFLIALLVLVLFLVSVTLVVLLYL